MTHHRPADARTRTRRQTLALWLVVVVGLVTVLTGIRQAARTGGTTPGVMTDALGPDPGEPVAAYLARARQSLVDPSGGDRWALVSFASATPVPVATNDVASVPRLSRVYLQTPVDGVAMPVVWGDLAEPVRAQVPGPHTRAEVLALAVGRAADDAATPPGDLTTTRSRAAAALTATRIRGGDPAIIALVVHAPVSMLRVVATAEGVRAVEALPADATWGRFAVRPLAPQQTDRVDPLPDTAPIPAS